MNRFRMNAAACLPRDEATTAVRPAWPGLPQGEVHVWKACLDGLADEDHRALLSPDELVRAGLYRFARDRLRFVAGRAILRMILGRYLGRDPAELVIVQGAHGKPRLALEKPAGELYFNVSHADSIALYAVARGGEVGVDVERVREIPDWAGIADRFFRPQEQLQLQSLTGDRRRIAFLQAWTRREALLKASGDGLTGETEGRPSPRDEAFSVSSLVPAPGYLAALASGFPTPRVVFMTWSATPGRAGPGIPGSRRTGSQVVEIK